MKVNGLENSVASVIAHFFVGTALALPAIQSRTLAASLPRWMIPIGSGVLAVIPDLDLAGRRLFGIPPSSLLSHRGLFHSPFFLIVVAAILATLVTRRGSRPAFLRLWLIWAGCAVTHPILDALTSGGRGVMLLLPFSRARLFFAWRPISNPIGVSILSKALELRVSELPFCIGSLAVGLAVTLARPLVLRRAAP